MEPPHRLVYTWEVEREICTAPERSRVTEAEAYSGGELNGHSSNIQALADRLRELVRKAAPNATEAGYPGWRLIGYRAPHYFCFIAPHAEHVRLGLEHGHRLSDPVGVLEPMGKQVRFVRLVPGQRVPVTAIRGLIRAALTTFPKP